MNAPAPALDQLLPAALGWAGARWRRPPSRKATAGPSATRRAGPRMRPRPDRLVRLFTIQKIFYEVAYEAANRPAWLRIPLSGILDLFGNDRRQEQ
jgi:predicted trehalose synthase